MHIDSLDAPKNSFFKDLALKLPFLSKKNKAVGYGHIETGFFHYITPQVILCAVLPLIGLAAFFEPIEHMFMSGKVALNVLILIVFVISVYMSTNTNITIFNNANYLKRLGQIIDGDKHGKDEVNELLTKLKTQGNLFDTNHMEACIKNIERFGHPNFTDVDARLIKSKLGQRIGERRKSVGFLGGLLVMLGLVGTFVGLLHTVDQVGEVMQEMAKIGEANDDAMSGFIGKLASPLKGMGVAFSASLFAIGGSVLAQVYGNFTLGPQSEFIENVSRWIDDRIPKFTSADKDNKDKIFGRAASADDLRTWLAGFVNLSVQSNRKLGQLISVLSASSQASIRSARAIDQMMLSQKNTQGLLEAMSVSVTEFGRRSTDVPGIGQIQNDLSDLKMSARQISAGVPALSQTLSSALMEVGKSMNNSGPLSQLQKDFAEVKTAVQDIMTAAPDFMQTMKSMNNSANITGNSVKESLVLLGQAVRDQSADISKLSATLQDLPSAMSRLIQTQELLMQRLESLPSGVGSTDVIHDPFSTDIDALSGDLNGLMERMNVENSQMFDKMFGMAEEEPDAAANKPITEKN